MFDTLPLFFVKNIFKCTHIFCIQREKVNVRHVDIFPKNPGVDRLPSFQPSPEFIEGREVESIPGGVLILLAAKVSGEVSKSHFE
jgi:hypothetical protein